MYLITQDQKIKILFTEVSTLRLVVNWTNSQKEILGVEVITPKGTYQIVCKTKNNREYILAEYPEKEDAEAAFNALIDYFKALPVDSWGDESEYEIGSGATPPEEPPEETPPGGDEPDPPLPPDDEPDPEPGPDPEPDPEPEPDVYDAVVTANLTAVEGENPPIYGHATSYEVSLKDSEIYVEATDLQKTVNANGNEDYWVGVGLLKQDDAVYSWDFGTKPETVEYRAVERTQSGNGAKYTTLYWASDDTDNPWSETEGYVSVKVGEEVTDYIVHFDISVV